MSPSQNGSLSTVGRREFEPSQRPFRYARLEVGLIRGPTKRAERLQRARFVRVPAFSRRARNLEKGSLITSVAFNSEIVQPCSERLNYSVLNTEYSNDIYVVPPLHFTVNY